MNNRIYVSCATCDKRLMIFKCFGVWSSTFHLHTREEVNDFLLDHIAHDLALETENADEPRIPLKVG